MEAPSTQQHKSSRTLEGVVVSDVNDKTIVVEVTRFVQHPTYKKYIAPNKRYKAHDEANECRVGDRVTIEECRPLSKDKRFTVIERAPQEVAAVSDEE
ncbi:MAG: 30S ribosomal protein S17 [Candidatus Paceibacterota bacterium]